MGLVLVHHACLGSARILPEQVTRTQDVALFPLSLPVLYLFEDAADMHML